jgi:hypothetical protein
MVRQRAGAALRHALLQLSLQEATASTSSLTRLCASTCAAAEMGTARSFSSIAGQLLPELRWLQQEGEASTGAAAVPCQQLISLRGFRSTTAGSKHALSIVHSHYDGELPLLQRTQWQLTAQQWSIAADLPSGSQQALQHQRAAVEVGSFRADYSSHRWQTGRSPGAVWQRGSAHQPAAPRMLSPGAPQPSGAWQMHSVAAAWQRSGQQQTSATAPAAAAGRQARGFATAWQRGRAAQNLNKRGGRDAAPEPPKKPRTNSEIDGPHVRLVFPDGTHKVPALSAAKPKLGRTA